MSWPAKCSLPVAVCGSKTLYALAPYYLLDNLIGFGKASSLIDSVLSTGLHYPICKSSA